MSNHTSFYFKSIVPTPPYLSTRHFHSFTRNPYYISYPSTEPLLLYICSSIRSLTKLAPSLDDIFLFKPSKPRPSFSDTPTVDLSMPTVDLSMPTVAGDILSSCREFGFFKVTSHGVSQSLISKLEAAAVEFFALPELEKEKAVLSNPFGYGNRKIGRNGDISWLEYLLLEVTANSPMFLPFLKEPLQSSFCSAMKEYVSAMKKLATGALELMADGLGMEQRNVFSKYINDEKSDSFFWLNHYLPCPMLQGFNQTVNGFGEHTDPQIISVMRSTNSDGLQVALRDDSWVSIPPDHDSFFVNVGDSPHIPPQLPLHRNYQNSACSQNLSCSTTILLVDN